MKKALFLLLSIFLISVSTKAQSVDTANTAIYLQMMDDPNANFFEIQSAFETYWDGREKQPGDGWKVFKRWEWYWQDRVNTDGSFPNPESTLEEYTNWRIAFNQSQSGSESINGDWQEIGPITLPDNGTGQPNGNGRLNAICFHPTDSNTIWVGAPAGGLWKTTDGGTTWTSNTDDLPTLGVSAILIDPTNTNIMYIGTGDRDAGDAVGLGVYKSVDGGNTWSASNTGMGNKEVSHMIMHPTNSQYILAATSGGIYRTVNGGSSWTLESSNSSFYKDIKWMPGSSSVAYATETSGSAGFYKTTNGGDTWVEITSGLPSNGQRYVIGVSQADTNVVYLLSSISSSFDGLYKSTNAGTSFSTQSTTPNILGYAENGSSTGGQGWYDLCIEVDPNNANIVYAGGVNIFKSTDGGVTWDCAAHWVGSSTAASVHADQHWLAFSPVDGKLYACNDGGLYYTADGGVTWPELTSGIAVAQIYRIGVSANTDEFVINGYQDNGTAIWDDTLFRTERGGDGMECLIDPNNDNIVYATVYYGNIARSFDAGYNFGSFAANGTNGITESGAWVAPFILDRQNSDIMFIGYKNVWRTTNATDGTPTFTAISNNLGSSNTTNIRRLRQSKVNSNRLFMIRHDNKLFRTNNALASTPSWADLSTNLPGSGTLIDIETDPFSNGTLWIIRGTEVYKSTNSGSTWTMISGTLPNISLNTLVADPLSNGGLYVGTDAGVYYIDNTLSSWIAFDEGLPANVEITELEIYHPQGNWLASKLRAGTYGRGLWESDLYDPTTNAPTAFLDVSLDNSEVCSYDTITLYNNSAYGVTSSYWSISPNTGVSFVGGTSATTMNPKIVISQAGSYDITLLVGNANGNDSITVQNAITINAGTPLSYLDDFETETISSTSNCELTVGLTNWNNLTNGIEDDIDFRVYAGSTGSGGTGPTTDYDPGTSTGKYIYTEASWCFEQQAILESPCILIDEVTSPKIKFAYHMYASAASQMGSLALDVMSSGSWSNLVTKNGNQGNAWATSTTNLNSYIGETVKFRLVATTGIQYQSDIAVDAIEITGAPLTDFAASTTTPCVGETVLLTDSSSQNPTNWNWTISPSTFTFVGGTNASSQNPQVQFNQATNYTITLQAINPFGNDFEVKSNYILANQPTVSLTTINGETTFCEEDTIHLVASSGYAQYEFVWNGQSLNTSNDSSYQFSGLNTSGVMHVIATDSNGCSGQSNLLNISLKAAPTGVLSCSDTDLEICDGDTVTFTVNSSTTSNYDFHLNGNSVQSGISNQYTTDQTSSNDSFYATLYGTNGCIGTTDTLTLNVLPLPNTPSINLFNDSLQCSIPAQMYRWKHDSTVTTSNSDLFAKLGDGNYSVRIFEGGCWSLWSEPFIITGIQGLENFTMKAYPSPAVDIINIQFDQHLNTQNAAILIVDMNGKVVEHVDISDSSSRLNYQLNISELATGLYNIVVKTEKGNSAIPFVKEKR